MILHYIIKFPVDAFPNRHAGIGKARFDKNKIDRPARHLHMAIALGAGLLPG